MKTLKGMKDRPRLCGCFAVTMPCPRCADWRRQVIAATVDARRGRFWAPGGTPQWPDTLEAASRESRDPTAAAEALFVPTWSSSRCSRRVLAALTVPGYTASGVVTGSTLGMAEAANCAACVTLNPAVDAWPRRGLRWAADLSRPRGALPCYAGDAVSPAIHA